MKKDKKQIEANLEHKKRIVAFTERVAFEDNLLKSKARKAN